LAASSGSSLIGFIQSGGSAVARTAQDELRESVKVTQFDADPTGVADSTAAVQAATNTGKAVEFPDGTYKVSGVTYTGKVVWFSKGNAKILSDSTVLTVTSGTGSLIDNLEMENITAPWIITRDPTNWTAVMTPVQSNSDGYQPTVNDLDVWPTLTAAQKNQDIGPAIKFQSNASDIQVSRIRGRFVSILMFDTIRSVVRDCDFRGGKNAYAGIVFYNIDNQAGSHNRAINNHVRYASFCGITFVRQFDGAAIGNHVEYVGESGIKTYQNTVGGVDARCYRMQIIDNNSLFSYYDCFDVSADYPPTGTIDTRHQIIGNNAYGARQIGFWGDGQLNQLRGNYARACNLSGIKLTYNYSQIDGNFVYDCNTSNTAAGEHQIVISGDNNSIRENTARQVVANGQPLYATGTNHVQNNNAFGPTAIFLGNNGAVTASDDGNVDGVRGLLTSQSFQLVLINSGGVIKHLTKAEGIGGGFGAKSNRVASTTNALTTTPTGADASTAFAAGVKIGSATTNALYFDTADQYAPTFECVAAVEYNDTGTQVLVTAGLENININGVTRRRLSFRYTVNGTGAAFALTTANIGAGKSIQVRFFGKLS
jgi:hypothetical protein